MRCFQLIVSFGLLLGVFDVSSVVAKTNGVVGQYSSPARQQALLKNRKYAPDFPASQEEALSQRGGGESAKQSDAVTGAVIMALIERGINKLFVTKGIKFPSALAGCIALFFSLLLADGVSPGLGESMFVRLTPGSVLLAKWLPAFFVPGLAMLPLAPSVGSAMEVVKVFLVVALGFICSMHCVAYTVLFLRAAQGTVIKSAPPAEPKRGRKDKPAAAVVPSKPFSDDTMAFLLKGSIITGGLSIAATRNGNDWASPLQSIFHILATFATYVWGARLPPGFNKTVHPLITSTVLTLGVIRLTGMATGSSFLDVLKTFKVGNLDLMTTGAGDMLLFLLGPTVVGFAVSMYSRKTLLKENFLIVMAAMLVSSVFSLFGTAAVVKAIQLGGSSGFLIRLSVLARNVTTALAMAITTMLGGDVSIIAVVVVMSGIIGATYGRRLLDYMGIVDPIARGLALGSSGQGLGVSSMVSETDAFPFAAMGLVLNAVLATLLVSIPAVKEILVNLCK